MFFVADFSSSSFQRRITLGGLVRLASMLMDWPAKSSPCFANNWMVRPVPPWRKSSLPPCKVARGDRKSSPWTRPAAGVSGISTSARWSVQLVSFAGGANGFGALGFFFAAEFVFAAGWPWANLRILSRKTNAVPPTEQNTTRRATAAEGNFFADATASDPAAPVGDGRLVTSEAVSTRFGDPAADGCGTISFRKHVGHSICEPLVRASHVMCWPHTGQANLNSLMLRKAAGCRP